MSKIVKTSISEARRNKGSLKSDWNRVDRLSDEEIEKAIESDPDVAQALNEKWFKNAVLKTPYKNSVTLRLDSDIVSFFKKQGKGYQTRINRVLRAFMEAHT